MQTTIGIDGKPATTINKSDRKKLDDCLNMALHVQANVPALKEIGLNTATGIRSMLKHFDTPS